jgi:O-antigen/teichoic acid export membrane protein
MNEWKKATKTFYYNHRGKVVKRLNKLFEKKFVKNIVMVAGGTAFAQLLTIAISPIITRIYPPQEYGVLSVYVSLLTLLSIGASLDYQKAIPISEDDQSAYNLIAGASFILFSFVVALSLVFTFWGEQVMGLLNSEVLIDYMYLISFGVLFVGGYNIILHWSLRTKDFRTVTRTTVTQSIASNISKIGLGLIGLGPLGLILGQIIGQSGGISRLSSPLIKKRREIAKVIKWIEIKKQLIRYHKFPLFSAPSNYVYTAGSQAPVIILAALFGTTVAGLYGLANSIVSLPIGLLAMSVSQVFYSEAASIGKSNPNRIKSLSIKLSSKLALIGLAPLLVFVLFGPWLFSIVFGQHWYDAGVYARVLAFVSYAHFVILPAGRILEVIEQQNIGLVMNIFRLALIILAFISANLLKYTAIETVILYTFVSTLSYLILFIVVQKVLSKEIRFVHKTNQ